MRARLGLLLVLTVAAPASGFAQAADDTRTQYPVWLANSYFGDFDFYETVRRQQFSCDVDDSSAERRVDDGLE